MATITKRNNSYSIRVSCGYDRNGKQIIRSKTWKVPENVKWSEAKVQKEVQKAAALFEKDCDNGYITATIKFEDFCNKWFEEYAKKQLKPQTIRTYHYYAKLVNQEIGHMRLDKITVRTVQDLANKLSEENRSGKSIKDHIGFISGVFNYAQKQQIVQNNPCRNVALPKNSPKEREVYTLEEVQQMLELFEKEDESEFKYVIFFTLAVYTGLRRGELLGLEWKDFNFENNFIYVKRTSEYLEGVGMYTDTPKTTTSTRYVRFPDEVREKLLEFKAWQDNYKQQIGDKWEEHDRLFTDEYGKPMSCISPRNFFIRFCKKTGMRFVNIHSFRHFNASMLVASGMDIKTVQTCLGHSNASTTLNIYAHAFETQQILAMDKVADCILGKQRTEKEYHT